MKPQVAKLLVGVSLSLLLLSVSGCAGVLSGQQAAGAQTPTKWEYNLGTVIYDAECAAKALEPYKNQLSDTAKILGLNSKEALALAWQFSQLSDSALPSGAISKILQEYLKCGQTAFDTYAGPMGDQGWEMVSYQRFQYTAPGSSYTPTVVVDYGYEVMWKRPQVVR